MSIGTTHFVETKNEKGETVLREENREEKALRLFKEFYTEFFLKKLVRGIFDD